MQVWQLLLTLAPALFISGIIEHVLYKFGIFDVLNTPICKSWFGENKKWRGLVSLPLLTTILVCIFPRFVDDDISVAYFGFLSALAWNIAELPNSLFKRKILNIGPGEGDNYWVCFILDHLDSTMGVCILLHFVYGMSIAELLPIILFSASLHCINHKIKNYL